MRVVFTNKKGKAIISEVFKIEVVSFAVPPVMQGGAPGINLNAFLLVADVKAEDGEMALGELCFVPFKEVKIIGSVIDSPPESSLFQKH